MRTTVGGVAERRALFLTLYFEVSEARLRKQKEKKDEDCIDVVRNWRRRILVLSDIAWVRW